jgi:hypothetical protein
MCRHTEQRMDVMNHHIDILCKNREIIHRQRDGPLIEFPEDPIYPPIPDPYASLAQTELATFGVGIPHAPTISNDDDNDNDDAEEANDDEEMEDDE